MIVVSKPRFDHELNTILSFIATDSVERAYAFRDALRQHLDTLPHFPYKFRQSIHYDDTHIRDYVFKGYTIPYLIDTANDTIVVLDIFKWTQ